MKTGIHPEYKEVTIRCACGEAVTTRSTKSDANGEIRVEVCSKCHPFFTGKEQASYKPYIIAAMIFLAQVKDPVKALMDLDSADNKRKMF